MESSSQTAKTRSQPRTWLKRKGFTVSSDQYLADAFSDASNSWARHASLSLPPNALAIVGMKRRLDLHGSMVAS